MSMETVIHRDGTISYWSVYRQVRREHVTTIPDEDLAALPTREREKIIGVLAPRELPIQQRSDGRWVCAAWIERAAQYQAPMTARERHTTGAHTWVARTVDNLGGGYIYKRRADALRHARLLAEGDYSR